MAQAEDNCQSLYNSDGEISAVKCSREDGVMEEEIIEDSDKEGDDDRRVLELDSNYVA